MTGKKFAQDPCEKEGLTKTRTRSHHYQHSPVPRQSGRGLRDIFYYVVMFGIYLVTSSGSRNARHIILTETEKYEERGQCDGGLGDSEGDHERGAERSSHVVR